MSEPGSASGATPFLEVDRARWAALAPSTALPLPESDLLRLRGLGEPLDAREVADVYVPLSRLLNLYATARRQLQQERSAFLREPEPRVPFVIGIAGSVAVGKSTVTRLLRELLPAVRGRPAWSSSPPTASCCRTPSSSAAGSCTARAFRSPTTGGRCCASSAASRAGSRRCGRPSTRTSATTSCRP